MIFLQERLTKMVEYLSHWSVPHTAPVSQVKMFRQEGNERIVPAFDDPRFSPYDGDKAPWQGDNSYAWFAYDVQVPQEMASFPVYFELDTGHNGWDALNPQFLVYVDGHIAQGMDVNHRDVLLTDKAEAGQRFQVLLSAYSGTVKEPILMRAKLKAVDKATEAYLFDISVPLASAALLDKQDADYIRIIQKLNESINLLDTRKPHSEEYKKSLKTASEKLRSDFFDKLDNEALPLIACVGHTHIDVAWLWPIDVTKDKAVRSFATVIKYLEEYPDYTFMSSQPQLYKYVEKLAPELFAKIREAVKAGRWEPEGAMFVEADCNLSSGESLVRQILYGKRYFRRTFGRDNELVWLPDVFGYSAALPQIFKKSGIKYFMTTKISWNEFNKVPMDTFMWQGIDGTSVLTHFSPSRDYNSKSETGSFAQDHFTTYNAYLAPRMVKGAWQRYQQKNVSDTVLMSFGHGDGGGGPTRDMLENHKRLCKGLPGMPRTQMMDSRAFFNRLAAEVMDNPALPSWVGELYLEYHRGTYTSMARNKRSNRKSEFAIQNLETYAALSDGLTGLAAYPQDEINAGWEVIMVNQFHDILPGSSIKAVYDDSKIAYDALSKELTALTDSTLTGLVGQLDAAKGDLVVFNPLSFVYDGDITFELPSGINEPQVFDGDRALPSQRLPDGRCVFSSGGVPAKGYKTFTLKDGAKKTDSPLSFDGRVVNTPFYRVTFDDKMQMVSIYDKRAEREVLKPGAIGNQLMSYEDRPHNFDAWDVNNYYTEKSWPIDDLQSVTVFEEGPVRLSIEIIRPYLDSLLTQTIRFYADDPVIRFDNDWDWKEKHLFVKTLFPVDILSPEATFEIQYAHVKRPTHYNTSWDFARFEVCQHKWFDFAENGYGVAVLNDCKYGAHVHDGVMGLSLLKCATEPNPDADQERHWFSYALLPHQGDWREAGVLQSAYALNNPPTALVKTADARGTLPATLSLASLDQDNLIIETIKKAEDSDDIILRVYEAFGRRSKGCLSLGVSASDAWEVNLMEEEPAALALDGGRIALDFKPFEIKTVKVSIQGSK